MVFPKLGFTTGPGVGTTFTGPDVCQGYQYESVDIVIPFTDPVQNTYNTRTASLSFDTAFNGGSDLFDILDSIWRDVVNEFNIARLDDTGLLVETTLTSGLNQIINSADWTNLNTFHIFLDGSQANLDFWWGTSDMAKYGYMNFMNGNQVYMPMTWLNSLNSIVIAPKQFHNGFQIFLQPGVTGLLVGMGQLIPPPLQWSTSGSGSGTYPP